MKYARLGSSDLMVSEVCIGTTTYGMQNSEEEAHEQLDYALSRGVNFIDTAEMYPAPTHVPEYKPGLSEKYIGTYFAKHPERRKDIILATKVLGYMEDSALVPNRYTDEKQKQEVSRTARLDETNIRAACEASLRRLQTSYIDLYQLHWPDRYVPGFGARAYQLEYERDKGAPIRETLLALKGLLDEGKIKAYGLSNESTFGVCEFVRNADELGMPRPASIQNSFCLLDRHFESDLAEACAPRNYNIGLLPWCILAGGTLTGKYRDVKSFRDVDDESLKEARFVKYDGYMRRFQTPKALEAARKYEQVAKEEGITAATLAQAFCKSRWFVTSSIIGATSMEQLKENIDSFEIELSQKALQKIDDIHNENKDVIISVSPSNDLETLLFFTRVKQAL